MSDTSLSFFQIPTNSDNVVQRAIRLAWVFGANFDVVHGRSMTGNTRPRAGIHTDELITESGYSTFVLKQVGSTHNFKTC